MRAPRPSCEGAWRHLRPSAARRWLTPRHRPAAAAEVREFEKCFDWIWIQCLDLDVIFMFYTYIQRLFHNVGYTRLVFENARF